MGASLLGALICAALPACDRGPSDAAQRLTSAATPGPADPDVDGGQAAADVPARQDAADDSSQAGPPAAEVVLIVLGSFPPEVIDAVEAGLRESLPVSVRRGEARPLPPEAYYKPRRRYRAEILIAYLDAAARAEAPGARYLGLTDVDISTTKGKHKDWGIFGQAYTPGYGAVISSYRLGKGARSPEHFAFRVTNTAVHEIGHSLGLDHCDEPGCPMRDAEGSIATTDSSARVLGPGCAALLAAPAD